MRGEIFCVATSSFSQVDWSLVVGQVEDPQLVVQACSGIQALAQARATGGSDVRNGSGDAETVSGYEVGAFVL